MARKKKQFQVRQGDVLITAIATLPAGVDRANPRPRDRGRVILAYGEVTGHAHAIADTADVPAAAIYDDPNANDGSFVMLVESDTGLVHEEHGRIDLPAGTYRVTRQREWTDADEPRLVAD
jgi:hypothetical protein